MTRTPLKMKVRLTDSQPQTSEPAPDDLLLRPVEPEDLAIFFAQEQDPVANQMGRVHGQGPGGPRRICCPLCQGAG